MSSDARYQLGEFRLDPANECLWRAGEALPLRPKVYALLHYFCDNPGRILTKEELLDEVWAGTIVGDSVLKVCVRELRKLLGETTAEPRFIETVHRRGYRFRQAAPPEEGPTAEAALEVAGVPASVSPSVGSPPMAAKTLVGRDAELARLRQHLAAVKSGEPRTVFVSGGPGIGKTSLIEAFLAELTPGAELWVARGQCLDQFGTGEAYLPVLDALSRLARGSERNTLAPLLRERAPTWLAQLPWLLAEEDRKSLEAELFGATQGRMLREMLETLEALTLERTLILTLEDLHWADASTVDLLAAFARRRGSARVLLLGTVRPVDLILAEHPLKHVKRDLESQRLCDELQLEHLSSTETVDFVVELLGGLPPDGLSAWAHAHTDGSPLFLVNLVDSLRGRGVLERDGTGWRLTRDLEQERVPESVLALIDAMVERQTEGERRTLEAASVAGAEFSSAAVAAILEEPQDAVEERCDRLAGGGHFVLALGAHELPDGTPAQRYRFTHALYSTALLRRLPAARLRRYHERNAERGVVAYGERVGEVAGEVALEYELGGQPAQAVRFLTAAASKCVRRYANREACRHLEHALTLCAAMEGAERVTARIDLLERVGLARRSGGDMLAAAEAFDQMALQAGAAGQAVDVVRARLFEASAASWHDRARCLGAIEAARAQHGALTDGVLKLHARGAAGYWRLLWVGRTEADALACEAARAAAFAAGEGSMEGLHTVRLAWFHWLGGRYREAVARAREGVALSAAMGEFFDYLLGQYFLAWALLHSGEWGEMRRVLATALGMAERNGHASWAVLFRLLEAWLHHEARDFERASELAEAAGARAKELGNAYPGLLADTIQGLAYLGIGDDEAAFRCFDEVRDERSSEVLMGWTLRMIASSGWARARLHRGELEAAERETRGLLSVAEVAGERTAAALGRRTLAELAGARGEMELAQAEIRAALAHLEGEPAPLAAWRVHAAAATIFAATDAAAEREQRRMAAQAMEALAGSLDEGDPLRVTLLRDPDYRVQAG